MPPLESNGCREAPLVSVLICSYNGEEFVEATIRSVISQTYGNLEILVRDNASSDNTVEILKRLGDEDARIKVYTGRENMGAYGGLNYLLERARGKYVAVNDHDDIWHRDKITKQIEFLEKHGEYVGCGTAIVNHYERFDLYLPRRQPRLSTIAWHTSLVFRNMGKRYDTSVRIGGDFDFMKNILCENRKLLYNMSDPLVLRRIRANKTNLSGLWVNFGNMADILFVRIPIADKVPLLCRLLLSNRFFDYLVVKLFFRKNVLTEAEMGRDEILREYSPWFSKARVPNGERAFFSSLR